MKTRLLSVLAGAALVTLAPVARAQDEAEPEVALTPQALSDALSCRSREALEAFAGPLFLEGKPPAWMHELGEDAGADKATEGMIGLYGYRLSQPARLFEEPVDRVYFLQNWVVTLWPRQKVEAFIAAHKLERAPIKGTEQYYRFVDPDSGPMIGVFEPTGNATAAMLAKAFGERYRPPRRATTCLSGATIPLPRKPNFLMRPASPTPLRRIPPRAWARLSNRIAHNDRHGPDN
jgi:hypothetical protein